MYTPLPMYRPARLERLGRLERLDRLQRPERRRAPGRALGAGLAVAAAVSLGPADAAGVALPVPQQNSTVTTERPAGWLGVRVRQNYECEVVTPNAPAECDLVLDITEVQEGGPAEQGGMRPGDRMVAINGQDLTFMSWVPLRTSIRVGTPVSIDVNRPDGRYFMRVTPTPKPQNVETGRWIALDPVVAAAPTRQNRVFVVTLTDLEPEEGGGAFALSVRDSDDDVRVEPAALRVLEGRLQLVPLSDELPMLRREIAGTLRGITSSSYEQAANAVQVIDQIRARLPSDEELRSRLSRVAQMGWDATRLAMTFRQSWGGALFVPFDRELAIAAEADREGLMVVRVAPGTPASQLGLQEGDILYAVNDTPVADVGALSRAIYRSSGPAVIRWSRKGDLLTATFEPR